MPLLKSWLNPTRASAAVRVKSWLNPTRANAAVQFWLNPTRANAAVRAEVLIESGPGPCRC